MTVYVYAVPAVSPLSVYEVVVTVPTGNATPLRNTRYSPTPVVSVEAAQVTRIEVADCAAAVTFDGTVGGVVSVGAAGGGAGAAGGPDAAGGGAAPPPPPPQADNKVASDASAANTICRRIPIPQVCYCVDAKICARRNLSRHRTRIRVRRAGPETT